MKLLEVFDQLKINNGEELPDTSVDSDDVFGSGAFAKVKGDEDPHMINKISKKWDTGYNEYVEFLMDNKLAQANPHFPRIYVAQNGTKWKMEKLQYTLNSYLNICDDPKELKQRRETIVSMYIKDSWVENVEFNYWQVAQLLTQPKAIKLGPYRRALELVRELHSDAQNKHPQSMMALDLHDKNIMIRLSPVGPQLVIVDPLADMNEA